MDDTKNTIGLTDLLDEVGRDLDELRKKHTGDYQIKNVTMWWELERDRILARHNPGTVLKTLRRVQRFRRMMTFFFAGWLMMLVVQTAIRFWIS